MLTAWPRGTFGTDPHLPSHIGDIVIIGQSSDAVGDLHATPLGSMPGEMVLANAVYSMGRHGIVQRAPEYVALPITALTIIVIGLAFARFDSVRGSLVIGVLFYAFLIVANYLMFLTDYWFDFAVPLIGLYADRLFSAFEEHVKLRTITSAAARARTSEGSQ
jgi:CHASE2 domain-containing sensor protein